MMTPTLSGNTLTTTGVQIAYYFVCKRKLWLFSHNIQMEHTSENVAIGNVIHEQSYQQKRKEIQIGPIKIDFFEKNRARISEVKKSPAIEEAHIWQMKYYLYYLKQLGISVIGRINYPLLRKTEDIVLSADDEYKLKDILTMIDKEILLEKPGLVINSPICKKCSYYELCYV